VGLVQASLKVAIGSAKGRAHASHPGGSTQRIEGTRGWDCVIIIGRKAKHFLSPPFEKHSPAAAMLSLQDLAGELSDLDHVVKARRPMS
jgi:hypothetical protein